jgi:hypothetical protein
VIRLLGLLSKKTFVIFKKEGNVKEKGELERWKKNGTENLHWLLERKVKLWKVLLAAGGMNKEWVFYLNS